MRNIALVLSLMLHRIPSAMPFCQCTPRKILPLATNTHTRRNVSPVLSLDVDPSYLLSVTPSMVTCVTSMTLERAEELASPFFALSLFPYLGFLYYLSRPTLSVPRGVVVGFASLLSFVFLTIPCAICAKQFYGLSLADVDWLHGSAESLLTLTNLVTVVAFRQWVRKEEGKEESVGRSLETLNLNEGSNAVLACAIGTGLALIPPAVIPAIGGNLNAHSPYISGLLDFPSSLLSSLSLYDPPDNGLSILTWTIHLMSLIEFLSIMGFIYDRGTITRNRGWTELAICLVPLHASGLAACTYHLFYNGNPVLLVVQGALTFGGNVAAMWGAWRVGRVGGGNTIAPDSTVGEEGAEELRETAIAASSTSVNPSPFLGFEDLGPTLKEDNDITFVLKLVALSVGLSYVVKYLLPNVMFGGIDGGVGGEDWVPLGIIGTATGLNAAKWWSKGRKDRVW